MMLLLSFVLLLYAVPGTPILMKIYKSSEFQPTDNTNFLINLTSIPNIDACACQCLNNALCVTGNFFGMNQSCILFSSYLSQGQLYLINNALASVFSFPNRTTTLYPIEPPASMEWLFDQNFNTFEGESSGYLTTNSSNMTAAADPLWISPGYAGYASAVHFPSTSNYVVDQMFDLTSASFSLTAWIWIPINFNVSRLQYFVLFTHCQNRSTDHCLHFIIANDSLGLGFFNDNLLGSTALNTKQWYHASYVYDRSASTQMVYLNGNLDGNQTSLGSYAGDASRFVLGPLPSMLKTAYHDGYIDKLIFVSRVKNATELLDEATLVAYYAFDYSFIDSGPNYINSTSHQSTTFYPNGRLNQALTISLSNTSYFQVAALYYLGLSNYSYSFSLWIYPFINNETILQVSSSGNWCVPMIGFNKNGYLTVQILSNKGIYSATFNSSFIPLDTWTYVAMTYSTTNGIRLFINGALKSSNNAFKDYQASGDRCTITIGTSLNSNICAVNGTQIVLTQFHGKIDELRIYSRELSQSDILELNGI